nr:hypothetical protein OG781_03705 [Streptomyces sp. NBC_00830]
MIKATEQVAAVLLPAHKVGGRRVRRADPARPVIPTGKRKGQSLSVADIYRALAEHEKAQAYPEAVETAHVDFAALQDAADVPRPRATRILTPDVEA